MDKKSPRELSRRLGNYFAPLDLYQKTKALPFLGTLTCNCSKLVAGTWREIILDYEVGASGIADGAWVKIAFKQYSDWARFQTDDPCAANYISAEYQAGPCQPGQSAATVQALQIRFEEKGHEHPFQKSIIVDTIDGFIKPGDHIVIRLGDRRAGSPGTRVQTFVESSFRFRCFVDPLGTSRFAALPEDIIIDIIPGAPASMQLVGSRIIRTSERLLLIIRAEDMWGNTCWNQPARVEISVLLDHQQVVYETSLDLSDRGWAVAALDDIPTNRPGELTVLAQMPDHPFVPDASYTITVDRSFTVPRVYFADLHVHSEDSLGTNSTVYNLTYGRDVAGLDVVAYTANDFQINPNRWNRAVETIYRLNKDDKFVCFPGIEWCANSSAGGDRNVIFLHDRVPEFPVNKDGEECRSSEWREGMNASEMVPGAWPIEELYATYIHDPDGHLMIPHVGGRRCNLDWHHPQLERLLEIGSTWGQFPWMYQEAIAKGFKLGASANGDEHRGRCGGGLPGTALLGVRGGLTGIVADSLNRESIAKALRARHTWATTGERSVALLACNDAIQGDEFHCRNVAEVQYRLLGNEGWEEIAAYDHEGCIWVRNFHQELGYSKSKLRVRWGGARTRDGARGARWRGEISIQHGNIQRFRGLGFKNPEQSCWRKSHGQTGQRQQVIAFRSETYGDSDSVEIELSNLASSMITISGIIEGDVLINNSKGQIQSALNPHFSWRVSGQQLFESEAKLIHEIGGEGLFLSLERLTDKDLPLDISGLVDVAPRNGPHGYRPIYVSGRQRDGSRVWTSAMFIRFDLS